MVLFPKEKVPYSTGYFFLLVLFPIHRPKLTNLLIESKKHIVNTKSTFFNNLIAHICVQISATIGVRFTCEKSNINLILNYFFPLRHPIGLGPRKDVYLLTKQANKAYIYVYIYIFFFLR